MYYMDLDHNIHFVESAKTPFDITDTENVTAIWWADGIMAWCHYGADYYTIRTLDTEFQNWKRIQ